MRGLVTNVEEAKAYMAKLEGRIDAYDTLLAKTRYLAGNVSTFMMRARPLVLNFWLARQDLTLADLFHLPHESFLKEQGFDFVTGESSRWPNVARYLAIDRTCHRLGLMLLHRWWKEISSRHSWKKVIGSS